MSLTDETRRCCMPAMLPPADEPLIEPLEPDAVLPVLLPPAVLPPAVLPPAVLPVDPLDAPPLDEPPLPDIEPPELALSIRPCTWTR
jgi:hypothetical protein